MATKAKKAKSPTGKPSRVNPAVNQFMQGVKTAGKRPATKAPKATAQVKIGRPVDKLGGPNSLLDKLKVRRKKYEQGNPNPRLK